MTRLGVNVDHVATIRQARKTAYPDPVLAAFEAVAGGADQITIHLREDRRHIVDDDVRRMRGEIDVPLNLEMASADEIVDIACRVKPDTATLVPERRMELTTEGGLDVAGDGGAVARAVAKLRDAGVSVSLFIDPERRQVEAAAELSADSVEFHTGACCDAASEEAARREMGRLREAIRFASGTGMRLCAGHGINYENAGILARALPEVEEYNIGHAIVARALFVGMAAAVREMKSSLARSQGL